MLKAEWAPYTLKFREVAITSREKMKIKSTYFVRIFDPGSTDRFGIGECALFRGLSDEDSNDYEKNLDLYCKAFSEDNNIAPSPLSSIRFGFETALADLQNGAVHIPFPSQWTQGFGGILINGLVWMGTVEQMYSRALEKIEDGFRCIKFKIGGCDFNDELTLLRKIRERYPASRLEIRLDANGAFTPEDAMKKLIELSEFDIHSIEQPLKPRQWNEMARLCSHSPIPIALDEELIGITSSELKQEMLLTIRPAFIILKPSLCGGFSGVEEWIDLARENNIGWWVTSALESAVGLNAIASWTARLETDLPQGLGTGQLYTNDIYSPVYRESQNIFFNSNDVWAFPPFDWR